jgi:hypothetical protein
MNGFSDTEFWAFLIPIVAIIGAFVIAGLGIYRHIRLQEFAHRERLALIEKGLVPPDKTPSEAYRLEPMQALISSQSSLDERTRRAGVVLVGIGFGIAFLIWMAGHEPDAAVGVGGFLLILGAAIYASSYFGGGRRRGNWRGPEGPGSGVGS